MPDSRSTGGARRGAFYGLSAACLFGVSAPIAKLLLGEVGPQILAGLLYLGAGIGLSAWLGLRPPTQETPLRRRDLPTLVGVVISGGVVGPVLMLVGLQRTSAVTGSLLLNLEGPFTIVLAVLVFREHLGRWGVAAAALVMGGAALLRLGQGELGGNVWGMAAIAGACLAWALDNNLTQRLSTRDPFAIVRVKALAAAGVNLGIGLALGHGLPRVSVSVAALVLGAFSYGVSVVLDAYALRLLGAAREAAYFAMAPFIGALAAIVIVGESMRWLDGLAMLVMASGVLALLRERHAHRHGHELIEHEHLHVHDQHHQHQHAPGASSTEPHAHSHRHEALEHDHPHVPDLHHRHRH